MNKVHTRKTQIVASSLTPQCIEYIDHLLEDKGFVSKSEVMRAAITFYHDKTYPNYIYNRSATDMAKRQTLNKNNDLEDLSDLEYAQKYLPGGLYFEGPNTQDGEMTQVYLIFDDRGDVRPWALKNVKRFYESQKQFVSSHRDFIKQSSITEALDERMCKQLKEMWLINVPEHYTGE